MTRLYVAYVYKKGFFGERGFGSCDLNISEELPLSPSGIESIQNKIAKDFGFKKVIVLNYLELRSDE